MCVCVRVCLCVLLIHTFSGNHVPFMQELQLSRNEVKARVEEVKKVKRENRKRKKVIEAYQEMMNAGATGLHTVSEILLPYSGKVWQIYSHELMKFW